MNIIEIVTPILDPFKLTLEIANAFLTEPTYMT
jgi:hypothetical protein